MSGFVGLVMRDGAPVDRQLLQRLTAFMAFRGPDEQGLWSEGEAGLGHALLRTTFEAELEHQPFSLDHQVWIAGDIRLDGRAELSEALRAKAQSAKVSAPDAELALQAYAAWGEACVEHLIGDFAFAVWDGRQRRLFCARDQFGVCPFYYAQLADAFVFGNTLACLRLHPGVSAQLNEQAIADFLLFRHNQDQTTTTFADIRCLPPAHCLTLAVDQLQIRRYWQWPEAEIRFRSPEDTVEQFKTLFEQAIADRLRTDRAAVPMSGGMDSSSVAVTACRVAPPGSLELRAFTLTMDHVTSDEEGNYARMVSAHAGIPIQFIRPTPTAAIDIDHAPRAAPEPVTLPSHNGRAMLGQEVMAFSRVTLSGLGGDPLLMPAPGFLHELVKRGRWRNLARAVGQHWRLQGRPPSLYVRSALRNRFGRKRWPPLPAWLNPSLVARLDLPARWHLGLARIQMGDPRRDMSGLPFWTSMLTRHDPGFTSAPLKTRFPFFDVRLLNFVLTTPPVPWFENKTLLREAMRGALPEAVRLRRKAPFAGDIGDLAARSEPMDWMGSLGETPGLELFVNRERLLQIVRALAQSTRQERNSVQAPLALGYWLRGQSGLGRSA